MGSGFPSILKAWHDTRLAEPMLVEQTELMQVKLTMQIVLGNNDFLKDFLKELAERQIDILKIINTDFLITTQGIADKTGTTDRTVRNDIKTLKEKGLLDREGGRKDGKWIVTGNGVALLEVIR